MEHKLPDVKVFEYQEACDFFTIHKDYKGVLWSFNAEWMNEVNWIGQLLGFEERITVFWDDYKQSASDEVQKNIKDSPIRKQNFQLVDPKRLATSPMQVRIWKDVLKSLHLNVATIIEYVKQKNEECKAAEPNQYLDDLEEKIFKTLKEYAENPHEIQLALLSKIGLGKGKLDSISQDLEMCESVFIHKKTLEIQAFFSTDFDEVISITGKDLNAEYQVIEDNYEDYIRLSKMGSNSSFVIMEEFAFSVDNQGLQHKLYNALNNQKPFRKFKKLIDNSAYREAWFEFRDKQQFNYLLDQLEELIISSTN